MRKLKRIISLMIAALLLFGLLSIVFTVMGADIFNIDMSMFISPEDGVYTVSYDGAVEGRRYGIAVVDEVFTDDSEAQITSENLVYATQITAAADSMQTDMKIAGIKDDSIYTIIMGDSENSDLKIIGYIVKEQVVKATGITLDYHSIAVAIGAQETLTASVTPEDATYTAVQWQSANEKIATVDEHGTVTGISDGITNIIASTIGGEHLAVCKVVVNSKGIDTTAPMLQVSEVSGKMGDSIAVSIELKNSPGLTDLSFSLDYDGNALGIRSARDEGLFAETAYDANFRNPYNVNLSSNTLISGSGIIATINFYLRDEAKHGEEYPITLSVNSAKKAQDDIELAVWDGSIEYESSVPTAATPVISVSDTAGGKMVSMVSSTAGARIYYTTDGSEPTENSELYSGQFTYSAEGVTTIKAIAAADGYMNSKPTSQAIVLHKVETPKSSVESMELIDSVSVELSCNMENSRIYYTTDGTEPTSESLLYTGEIIIGSTTTLKIKAVADGMLDSDVNTYEYTRQKAAREPYTLGKDTYSFGNYKDSFGYSGLGYRMPLKKFTSILGESLGKEEYNAHSLWEGSCFGMAATSLAFYNGDLDVNDYHANASDLYEINAPGSASNKLTELIEEFQISQYLTDVANESKNNKSEKYLNWENLGKLVRAVQNFAETGEDGIIISVFGVFDGEESGHAVVPTGIRTDENGDYLISVYENISPQKTDNYIKINKNMDGFSYKNKDHPRDPFDTKITFNYESTILEALGYGVSLMSASDKTARIIVNSTDVTIENSYGVDISEIDNAYEVNDVNSHKKTVTEYVVPYGEYHIRNNVEDIDDLRVAIATDLSSKTLTTDDTEAQIIVKADKATDETLIYANSKKKAEMMVLAGKSNSSQHVLKARAYCLGLDSTNGMWDIESTAENVSFNGDTIPLTNLVTGDDMTLRAFSLPMSSVGSSGSMGTEENNEKLTTSIKNNSLKKTGSKISGDVDLNIYNNSNESMTAELLFAVYDSKGAMKYLKTKEVLLGGYGNYIDVGDIDITVDENGGYYAKCFVWNSIDGMMPVSNSITAEIN